MLENMVIMQEMSLVERTLVGNAGSSLQCDKQTHQCN